MSENNIIDRIWNKKPEHEKRVFSIHFDIGILIYETLKNRDISYEKFAKAMNISVETVYEWLGGCHEFTFKEIALIEQYLKIEILNINLHLIFIKPKEEK